MQKSQSAIHRFSQYASEGVPNFTIFPLDATAEEFVACPLFSTEYNRASQAILDEAAGPNLLPFQAAVLDALGPAHEVLTSGSCTQQMEVWGKLSEDQLLKLKRHKFADDTLASANKWARDTQDSRLASQVHFFTNLFSFVQAAARVQVCSSALLSEKMTGRRISQEQISCLKRLWTVGGAIHDYSGLPSVMLSCKILDGIGPWEMMKKTCGHLAENLVQQFTRSWTRDLGILRAEIRKRMNTDVLMRRDDLAMDADLQRRLLEFTDGVADRKLAVFAKELESQLTLIKTTAEFKTAELVANLDTLTIDVRHYIAFQFIIGSLAKANDASPADVSHMYKDAYT